MYIEYRSITDLNNVILSKLSVFPRDIDLIVGVPRSGMLAANLLALYLNKPYTDIDSFLENKVYSAGERGDSFHSLYKNILVIDDSIFSGSALVKSKSKLASVSEDYNIKYGVIYATSKSKELVDFYCEVIDYPRIFQWNLFHHGYFIPKSCFDIDGVLCPDPPVDDDGPIYLDYITNAPPLYIPTVEINTLVTCRLEKYREATEAWLKKNNVRYKELIMLDFPNKKTRMEWGQHGKFKGDVYKKSECYFFVESSLHQAIEISRVSKKTVFCIENFSIINNNVIYEKGKHKIMTKCRSLYGILSRKIKL